ncbi:non-ribosomal peptide synthase/polyketide synthase [Mycetohabitans rhizoxinica]|uniref:non-ribosomal peptide synthetase n=1 Tax=Mycetohabitans rhizoxinica TaxID=412963 RepID=UPI0030CD8CAE
MSAGAVSLTTYPLSSAQTEIWLAQQLHSDSPVYNIAQYTVIEGAIDPTVFEAALRQVIDEVDSLRLQFVESEAGLRQRIGSLAWSMPVLDLTAEADPQAAAQAWMRADYQQPVNVLQGPLFCYALLKVAPAQWIWYQRYHHIMMDGYGQYLIAQRVAHVYSALRVGEEPAPCTLGSVLKLLESDAQYQTSAQREKDEAYWLKHCAHWPEPATLANRAAPALQHRLRQTAYLATQVLGDAASDVDRLTQFLTAALAAYLHRMTGAQDVALGLPVTARLGANRHIPGVASNTVPLRFTFETKLALASLLQQAAQIQRGFRYQRYPSEALRRKLGLMSGQALFGATVNVMPFDYDLLFDGYPSSNHNLLNGPVEDLMLAVYWAPDNPQLRIDFNVNPACYTAEELEAHRCRFVRFMQALAADVTQPIDSIDLLDADERHRLLVEWNATKQNYPSHLCIHQLFEAQVERTPEATALVYEDQTFSYAQLNAQANRLAHRLIEWGVKPDARVAICAERSPALVVGLLAILKAGGAYVPLDPAYPGERLAHILADAAPSIVLADAAGCAALGEAVLSQCTVLDLGTLPALPDTNPSIAALTARHLAYVIYTSGSTGTPKGVMVEHAQTVNFLCWAMQTFTPLETQHTLFATSISFDLSVYECFMPLAQGSTVHLVKDALALMHQTQPVSLINTVPSALQSLLAHGADLSSATTMNLAGEPLTARLIKQIFEQTSIQRLCNLYGPSESTTYSTWRPMYRGEALIESIGRPIANTRVYLLDAYGQPVPLGAVGELYIGGAGVARGYLNRPELTAERFVPDPFSDDAGARLYKTGDLARYLPDGNLEFVGRNDEQVKIRGFRIEPGEIEACLTAHPQVRDAVVLACGEDSDKRLVAYVQAEADEPLASTLRAQVAASLPEYMVPSAFVRLDAFPLTPNGKLDRRALPEPDADALAHQAYEAPQGELETTLATIWAELLGVERVGRHDSFFALGGHSLLAVRLMNRVRELGADVPLATLFATPTLAAFAAALEAHWQQGTDTLPEIMPVSREGNLPLSFAQQRLRFLAQLDRGSQSYHMPLALHVRGSLDQAAWQQALDALWARHEALRSTFVSVEGQPQVRLLPADTGVPLRWHDLRGVPDAQAQLARLSHEATHAPFNLARGPLIHACGIQLADDEHVVLLTQHHIVSDGWSIGVMVREFSALYAASVGAQADPLPPLTVQYPDYAAWQRQWLTGERLQAQSDYWRATLADAPVLLALPTDRPRPAQQSFAGAHVPVRIDASTTQALKRLSAKHGTTLFMTVLAAWSAVLARLSGQHDLVIGTPSANRNHRQIEPLIGFFVNTLALRVDLSGEPDTAQLLARVRRTTLDAQAHQDLPFEQVVEIVQPPRRLSHTPLFQVMLAWQSNEPGEWRLPGLTATPAELEYDAVKFDLELNLSEAGEEIIGSLGYATALFDRSTIERHVGYLQTMLRAMVACPKQPVATLELLSPAERQLLLQTWNATQQAYPAHQCIHQLFEAQVERTPEAPALIYEAQTLSYAELNAQANRLAHQLIEWGVKPDTRVAVCVQRSPALVVGLLAVLKAGGVYVPLDPSYPSERRAYMLEDSASAVVCVQAATRELIDKWPMPVIDLDTSAERNYPEHNPRLPSLTLRHLAYVIYTSGSTGQPKGVSATIEGLRNRLLWFVQDVLKELPVTALKTSIGFVDSVTELLGTLLAGGKLVVFSNAEVKDVSLFARRLRQAGVSHLVIVPSLLRALLEGEADQLGMLRMLICSGERLAPELARRVVAIWPKIQLLNFYGSSEVNGDVTCYEYGSVKQVPPQAIIGRPISNTRVYLLDAYGQPVPLGAVGELYIGGAGVARGYLNRPELTAERFVPDPFSDDAGARLYKTGDLARYLPDGNLEFVGRNDEQVKIRGFRIEPGEIEACLTAHPQVRDAVVLACGEGSDKRLVAYVQAEADEPLASTLRAQVAASLPEYMVPSAFVRLDALPLTPNGKLDRRALPAPSADAFAHQAYEAPQGKLETTLAQIWSELLGVEPVGRHDNFFALGGHSLLAVRLMNRVAALGIALPLATLFAAPTLAGLAAVLEAQCASDSAALPAITPVSRDGALPLSFAQQRLWFFAQLDSASDTYHMPMALRLRGTLNPIAWQQALDALWARHEALRSVFVSVDGQPQVQLLPAEAGMPMTWHDLRGVSDAAAQLVQLSAEAAQAPFDLACGPLMRACGIQVADDEYVMLLVQHHIVSDGWSVGVLVRELNTLYRAACDAQTDPLPALTIQYPDYAAWQRQWLSGERLKAQSEYWRTQLADAPVLLTLPTDRPRPAQQSFAGAHVPIRIDAQTTRELKRLSQAQGATLFMTVLAAWSAVLARLSGQEDLVIGTASANRHHPQIEPLIGFFVNTLALRMDVSGEPSATQLLERVRCTALEAQAHQDLPFEQVVEIVQPPRRLEHTPLFQVMFVWQNNECAVWDLPEVEVTPVEWAYDVAKFDLNLHLSEAGGEMVGVLHYATALFDCATIERHIGYLQTMLQAMAADASHPVTRVELLSPAERTLLLQTWNATQRDYPAHQCIHQLFEAQVERTPEATALVYENQTLSYAELNDKANQLAHYLRALDVGPEVVVGLCAERSLEAIIGLLGILKAGGAYLPLDPSHPAERLASMLRQASVAVLVTQSHLEARLPEIQARRIDLDTDWAKIAAYPKTRLDSGVTAEHLAYIIYTSGSTGQPKGVMHSHRGVVNYLSFLTRHYAITCADTILNITGLAFDPCVRDLFGPLAAGARVIIVPNEQAKEPGRYLSAIRERSVTKLLSITPSFLRSLCETVPAGPIASSLNTILTSGEPLEASVCEQVHKAFGLQVTVVNQYGPSECTMASTWFKADAQQEGRVPIGRPVPNVRVYVLGQHLEPLPIGVTGELYIAGAGVARGYINQPELSAERFIPSPFGPGERLYQTGDLARWRLDGQLEYIGRVDQQIKIRGFRIEPGEIEAALVKHPSIAQSVVVSREDHPGDRRLVAYWVAADGGAMTPVELKAYLSQTLPDYMVPVAFVQLGTLPLTLSGKLNQRALPAPDGAAFALQVYEAPQGELETTLAAIWSELLSVKRVGRHDNFFALGGHSLLAVRLMNRVAALGIALPLATLFAAPTLAGLAAVLEAQRASDGAALPAITPVSRDGALPLSFAQQRLWFFAQLDSASDTYHMPMALRLRGTLNPIAWQQALDALWARHEALRSVFVSVDGQPQVQLLPAEAGMPMTWHDLRGVSDAATQLVQLSAEAAQAPFDLACGPLMRACGIQVADDEYVMLLVQHHIVSDGWSVGVLVRELNTLYRAACDGQTDPLPALTIQYPDYAAWQRQWLSGERLKAQGEYWRTQLADAPVLLTLPTDRPRPAQQSFEGAYVPIQIDAQTTQALKRWSQAQGATLFMTVLAAWSAVLARLSGQEDLVIGTASANRHHPQIEPLIGFFVNTLALRMDVSGEPSATQLLERVRCTALEAQAHQDLPFEQVVEIVQPPRRLEHTPLFQVMFVWQSNERAVWDLPEVEVTPAKWAYDVVKFDLDLHLYESGEEIVGALGYATALFDRATIERHVGYLQTMLQAMAADAAYPVTRVDLLSPAERTLLLQTWNATRRDYPAHQCIHQLFEAQVERTPEAIALVYEDQALSYAQLNARANRLAHQLIELGVQPDARVAICVQRSPALVVGLLAILKAGGAYVPLDPAYPSERLAHILVDAAPSIVLADAAGRAALGEAALAECTVLDPATVPALPDTNPSVASLTSRHLAYVIYTSGSTGVPKGVMVHHQGVVRLVRNTDYIKVEPGAVFALASNLAFDATTFEIWAPLLNGARIEVIERETLLSPVTLARKLKQSGVTVLFLTTALFNQMVKEKVEAFSDLHYLLFGGENADPRCVFRVLQQAKPRHLLHVYGPTETVTYASWYEVCNVKQDTSIPIGRPIANTRIYLLDRYGQPVPLGAVGELYIGGAGVARGYLNRPELTAERFVHDPFASEPDARMYKTGDLARYLPDGNLEFLGRNDHQVKIRGFRIELGEIEACLAQHTQVRDAVILATGEGQDKRLVAYVVADPDDALAGTLRTHVAAALPEYMVPSAFVRLDALPLTPNGKLDRRALLAPSADAFAHQAYEAPQGELETTLAQIWSELLGVEPVGRHDNFFALGGHSLLAVRLMNRVAALGIALPLATLFAAPTLAGLAAVLEAQRASDGAALPAITPVSRDGALPLSFAQQRLWFFAQLDSASDTYHMPMALRLRGTLNPIAWQQALDALWARHEALRSVFVSVDGQPQVQLLPAEAGMPMTWHDLRGVSDAATQLVQLSAEAAQAPFDLACGPLMRACGIQVADDEYVMLLVQHHIVSDGWSVGVLVRELNTLYRAACDGQTDPLPALTIQYPDYAAWQRQWLSGERLKAQGEYWRTQLTDAPVLLTLPTDRPRPAQQSFEGAYVPIQIDAQTTQALKRWSQAQGATLFMTVLAAWSAVLARLSGQEDLVIGTASANRHHPQIEPLIGFFVNTLALRMDVSGEPSATQLLERVRRTALEAQAHQDVPFEQVVEIVQPPRRLEHTPLFQVMFAWQSNERAVWDLPALEVTPADLAYDVAKFDLDLHLYEAGGEIVGALGYATALFDRATIERHVGYLQTMLQAMAADAAYPVTRVELLSPAERTLLLQTWNATQRDYPAHQCIHQLFEAQAERMPEAIALVYEDQALSYTELNARANRLAHQLIELGVVPNARVAICVQRSPAMVVGLLAILKAGGAYVPLDPSYPGERLAHILMDAAPDIVLADAAGQVALGGAALTDRTVLDPNRLPAQAETNPVVPDLTSRHLAYVIYTSGSTGIPKGVMVEHAQTVNFLFWALQTFTSAETQHTLLATSISFDLSIYECFVPLAQGSTVHLVEDALALMHHAQPVSLINTVPSALQSLLAHQADLSSAVTINMAGEPLKASLIKQVFEKTPVQRLCNLYGPSESTTYSTWLSIQRGAPFIESIGRPIANTRIYLLDRYGQPVPLGAVGELYIGGAGVARGYLNRPELTAERFVPDPFSDDAGARLYKTGDLARYLPDGNLEFVGRNDEQVKIRGFRIEPGEIEACLTAHPQVRDAVVLACGEGSDKRLVAYVQAEADEPLASTLRAQVAASLPEYMVPSAFVRLDALPLTPNGKLDRRALPAPSADAFAHQAYEAPQGELETTLAQIWSELLGVEPVGRHDNFFALGGHSLLAVRLMNRVAALGIALPLATLFAAPTLAGLAAVLEAQCASDSAALPAITPVSRDGALPLSFAQQRLWFFAQLDSASDTYHMPMALRLRGTLNPIAWQQALDALWARHEALRSVFVSVDGQPQVQLLPAEAGMPMTWHDLRGVSDAAAQLVQLSAEAAQAPFDLACGPLMRACGIQVADDEYVMLLVQHHIVSDGWSVGVLVRELNTLYRAACDAQTDPLPALTIQYPDYAAWQRQWLSGERLKAQSEYWRTQLADAPVLLTLPTDRPRPAQQSFAGAHVPIRIDAQTTRELKRWSQAQGATLFMTVLAAWSAVLARLSGQEDLVIGTASANRHHPQIEPLIGFFVNTLALRMDVSGEPSATQLLERVRCTALEAQAHQDLPFEQVVEIVQPPRRLDHTPLFQVMFVWQSNERGTWALPGLEVTSAGRDHEVAKFDLNLHMHEAGGEMVGVLHYATALFDCATIERHVGYLQTMLQAMAADASHPVTRVELLSPAERTLLLQTWNATQRDYPAHQCIHQLFEAQAERMPEAIALVYEDQALSYTELNARANRLAHQLIELGVVPNARVAICVQRSPAMVVGLLAILKAGGAYVPLDPSYPGERLAHILMDAAPDIVLADAAGQVALGGAALTDRTVLDPNRLPAQAETNPVVPDLTSRHLAYVIYTSGSTGVPKGVMVHHQGVVRLVRNTDYIKVEPGAVFALASNLAFDATTFEIWAPLLNGARIEVIERETLLSPAMLSRKLKQSGVTVLFLTTALFNQMVKEKVEAFSDLHYLLFGGENADPRCVFRVLQQAKPRHLLHVYGPTETVTYASWYEVCNVKQDTSIPIGRPIANTRIYLLDRYGQPVPLGAVGELYIGGAGVARGYLNRPELTAERFVHDPFASEPDARMYKTGDLARYLPDGNLEFLGRNDHQVKIRGFRIELGEIEACLAQHTQVRDAVILATGEGQDKRLVAYVVADPDDALAGTLRTHVAAALPEYMVPSAFVRLDALPLTPNGKLDRRALLAPSADAFAHQAYEAPQGELETTLAQIWSELLGVEQVSRHDNFFALGGHSLLAVQMISRSRTALGISIPMPVLFEAPTLAALAQRVSAQENVRDESFAVLLPIQPHGARPALFCVHPVTGLSWHYRGLVSHLEADQPVYGLQARGLDGGSSPALTIEVMALDYIQQIRCIQPHGPYYLLGWSFGGKVVHSMATQLEQQGERVALLAVLDATPGHVQLDNKLELAEDDFYHLFVRHAVGSLAEASHYLWDKTRAVFENNVQLVQRFSPRIYGGDMLFFRAAVAPNAWTQTISPEVWQPYVLGNIEVHDIACQHYDMELPVPTAHIGRILRQKLNMLQGEQKNDNKEEALI